MSSRDHDGGLLTHRPQGLLEGVFVEDLRDDLVIQVLALKCGSRNSILRTHRKVVTWWYVLVTPSLGRSRLEDCWGLLANWLMNSRSVRDPVSDVPEEDN